MRGREGHDDRQLEGRAGSTNLSKLLDQTHRSSLETPLETSSGSGVNELVIGGSGGTSERCSGAGEAKARFRLSERSPGEGEVGEGGVGDGERSEHQHTRDVEGDGMTGRTSMNYKKDKLQVSIGV
jgi:hypothetical protein